MKIRTKIALVFTMLTAVALLMLSALVYYLTLRHTHDNFFTRLKLRASMAAEGHFGDVPSGLIVEIRNRHLLKLPQERELFFDTEKDMISELAQKLPDVPPAFGSDILAKDSAQFYSGFHHYYGIAYSSPLGRHVVVAIAYDEGSEDQMAYLLNVLATSFSVSCLVVFGIGRVFARQIMKPIATIVEKVNTITASDLGERLEPRPGSDEIAELSNTFNNMLDRLETAFDLQSNFISNASHELRTPLTSILGEAEVTLASPRTTADYVESIQTIRHEAKKLDEVTTSLLKLSQISFDGKKQKIEQVLIDELLMSIKISLDKRMPGNQTKILIQPVEEDPEFFSLMCVRVWMEVAIINIIQNSIKYSDNKEVLVTLTGGRNCFFIQVSDYGIGIPREELPHIFEPFFRGSNTSPYTGYGIGLPLAARIVRLHGGTIETMSKENSGTQVSLKFPCISVIKNS